jgi:hypothetical protein
MRSVGLDLGVRHIAYCEVRDGQVVPFHVSPSRASVRCKRYKQRPAAQVGLDGGAHGGIASLHPSLTKFAQPFALTLSIALLTARRPAAFTTRVHASKQPD